jgi:hypothetical protein
MAPSGPGEGRDAADRWPDKHDPESAASVVAALVMGAEDLRQRYGRTLSQKMKIKRL